MVFKRKNVKEVIRGLFDDSSELTNREVVAATGLTRQAVHYHLRAMVDSGELETRGAGRSTGYRKRGMLTETYQVAGLEEHVVWMQVRANVPGLADLPPNVERVLDYAFTEMLNNAIDHSGSPEVVVTARIDNDQVEMIIRDYGVGALERVRRHFELTNLQDAAVAISKGKTTTDEKQHTGQGIFFTSKASDLFVLESNGVTWVVDNKKGDRGLGESDVHVGTRITLTLDTNSPTELRRIFDEYASELDFDRTHIFVELVQAGETLLSRSEAKRVAVDLDRFREALIDFTGVSVVGQGFADELFRVWANAHPGTALKPVGMSEAVEAAVLRALPAAEEAWKQRQGRFPLGATETTESSTSAERQVSGDLK